MNLHPNLKLKLCLQKKKESSLKRLSSSKKFSVGAFTLIELLVVVALLAILVTLVVQTVLDAKESSRQNAITATIKSLNQAQMRAFLSPVLAANRPAPNFPVEDSDAVNWYISNGLIRSENVDTNVLTYIERVPLPPGLANEQSIWRKIP